MVKSEKVKTGHNVIDITTGEIIMELCEGDRIVTRKQDEHVAQYITKFNGNTPFLKVYTGVFNELLQDLTPTEFFTINSLIPFISYKDNILRCDNKFLKIQEISDTILEKDIRWTRRVIKSLEDKDIIKKIKWADNGNKEMNCIVVNPYIYFKGTDIRREIVGLFEKSKWSKIT